MRKRKKYILTNNCYWYDRSKTARSPHYIEVCDLETGEITELKNGTIIEVVKKAKK
jgi:hypothetical protein